MDARETRPLRTRRVEMPESSAPGAGNSAFLVDVRMEARQVHFRLHDRKAAFDFADGPYLYRAVRLAPEGEVVFEWLIDPEARYTLLPRGSATPTSPK